MENVCLEIGIHTWCSFQNSLLHDSLNPNEIWTFHLPFCAFPDQNVHECWQILYQWHWNPHGKLEYFSCLHFQPFFLNDFCRFPCFRKIWNAILYAKVNQVVIYSLAIKIVHWLTGKQYTDYVVFFFFLSF